MGTFFSVKRLQIIFEEKKALRRQDSKKYEENDYSFSRSGASLYTEAILSHRKGK